VTRKESQETLRLGRTNGDCKGGKLRRWHRELETGKEADRLGMKDRDLEGGIRRLGRRD